jgi:hypothetical protein
MRSTHRGGPDASACRLIKVNQPPDASQRSSPVSWARLPQACQYRLADDVEAIEIIQAAFAQRQATAHQLQERSQQTRELDATGHGACSSAC